MHNLPDKQQLERRIRAARRRHIIDVTGREPADAAVYTLTDPRDVRAPRYVGLTRSPARRYAQHLRAARLWLPAELPWWIREEEFRPLYGWIRELFRDGERLPMMVITQWTDCGNAPASEQALIRSCLAEGLPLLNRVSRGGLTLELFPDPDGVPQADSPEEPH